MMLVRVSVLLCIFGIIVLGEQRQNSLNLIPKCTLADRDFLECWKRAIDILRPSLIRGIPELNIPPLEPFFVSPFSLTRNTSTVATYHIVVKDFIYSGASNFKILDYHVDPDGLTLGIKVAVPQLHFAAINTGAGNIFGMPFHGTGRTHGTIINLIMDISLSGGKYNRDGKFYIQWKTVSAKVKYNDFLISIKDIFPEPMSSIISQRVSQNRDLFESHVVPVLIYSLEPYIVNILNNVHAEYPFDVLYPKV